MEKSGVFGVCVWKEEGRGGGEGERAGGTRGTCWPDRPPFEFKKRSLDRELLLHIFFVSFHLFSRFLHMFFLLSVFACLLKIFYFFSFLIVLVVAHSFFNSIQFLLKNSSPVLFMSV